MKKSDLSNIANKSELLLLATAAKTKDNIPFLCGEAAVASNSSYDLSLTKICGLNKF